MNRFILIAVTLLLTTTLNAQGFKLDTLLFNGPVDSRVNYVFLGDGYVDSELDDFLDDAKGMVDDLFGQSPFKEYKDYFNVFAISVPSNESGAALSPNSPIDNYFGSTFGYAGIDRLLVPTKSNRVTTILANQFPEYDQVFMVVNSTKYGGSGGWIATSSVHSSAGEIAIHEIGHSFGDLRDEYWAGAQYALEKANMSRTSNPNTVRWKNWVGTDDVGVYEYPSPGNGWYKPHQGCKMQYLGFPFCGVCKETITEKVLSLTEPIIDYSPLNDSIVSLDDSVLFNINLLAPNPNTISVEWKLDEQPIKESASLHLGNQDVPMGKSKLEAVVFDETDFSRKDNATTYRMYTIKWELNKNQSVSISGAVEQELVISVYPNPARDILYIKSDLDLQSARVFDMNGRVLMSHNGPLVQIDIDEFEAGVYVLELELNGKVLHHNFIVE